MILHTSIFAWVDGTTEAEIARFENDLRGFAADVEGLESLETGRDGRFRDGNADFVVVARFTDEPALRRYLGHPAHHRMLDDYGRALVARKESVQAVLP